MINSKSIRNTASEKLPFSLKFWNGVGQTSDTAGYNLYYTYFLFFLTDIAGVAPAIAGIVSLIAVCWDAITDPIIGYLSDNCKSKHGRRRPFMITSLIPYCLVIILLFNVVDLGPALKNAYYIMMAILLWTFYTGYTIPYYAFGAELTQDFNERNSLRAFGTVFMGVAAWCATAIPVLVVDFVVGSGGSVKQGWSVVGVSFSIIIFICGFGFWWFTRGREQKIEFDTNELRENIVKTYISTLKIKPYRHVIGSIFIYMIAFTVFLGSLVYLMTYNLALSASKQSLVWTVYAVAVALITPVINYSANKMGKRACFIVSVGITVIAALFFSIFGFNGFTDIVIFVILFCIGGAGFWTLNYSMLYDITEVDEFISGKRREGVIVSLASFAQKVGAAVGTWLTGTILGLSGYVGGAEVQTASALKAIHLNVTVVVAVFSAISILIIIFYPITSKRFEALKEALALKKEGQEYSTEGFKELL